MSLPITVLAVLTTSLSTLLTFADGLVYKDEKAAEAELLPARDVKTGWSTVARGGESFFQTSYREFNEFGDITYSSSTMNSSSHGGAVLAIPVGDFSVRRKFAYKGRNKNGALKDLQGVLASVKVQVSTGGGICGDMALQKSVENMVKVGVSLSKGVGCKPLKYRSLVESAKKRFGARILRFRYCGDSSSVLLLLLDCDSRQADDSYLPATPHALTRDGRLALAKRLRANEDRSGVSFYASETEVHPVSSPYAPVGGGWQDLGNGIRRREEAFDSRKAVVPPTDQ